MAWVDPNREWLEAARKHWVPRTSEPLTLRAWLGSPVVWDAYDGITLEGALQFAVVVLETGRMPDDVFYGIEPETFADIRIPIADVEIGGFPIALASWGIPAPGAIETKRHRRKRARVDVLPTPGGRGTVVTGGGEFKALDIPTPTVTAYWLDFHVVGDRKLLANLLPLACCLGRSRSAGLGEVMGWEVLPGSLESPLADRGTPLRTIPTTAASAYADYRSGTYDLREATTRAPYWHRRSRTLCVVPQIQLGSSERCS